MQIRSCFVYLVEYNTMEKTKFKIDIVWMRLIILIFFVLYTGDVAADVDYLHVKRIH
jgi:hypothetical protein